MDKFLEDAVETSIKNKIALYRIREELLAKGYSEDDIEEAINKATNDRISSKNNIDKKNSKVLLVREFLDRIGFGAVSPQFINILFYQTGASLFLLGLIDGFKSITSLFTSSIMQEYAKLHDIKKELIGYAGIIFGFSFLIMAFARRTHAVWLFALAIIISAVGVVTYSDLFTELMSKTIRKEKMSRFLVKIGEYGAIITMISMLISGFVMDFFPASGSVVSIFGYKMNLMGYLLSFEITAFAFIISGYLLNKLKTPKEEKKYSFMKFLKQHLSRFNYDLKMFLKNKYILLLFLSSAVAGILQILLQSYSGLFIYEKFKYIGFGGFLNISIIYSIAVLASFTGPYLTKKIHKSIGLTPMLAFGTTLTAILPLALVFNPNLASVAIAQAVSVIGAAILGVAQGMLASKLMHPNVRKKYFETISLALVIPYLILIPIGAWIAQTYGFEAIFRVAGYGLLFIVAPLYVVLVMMSEKMRL